MPTYVAKDVAAYLVNKAIEEGKPLTQLQVQKLVVIAHGFCLAALDAPLVQEDVRAWRHGPVIEEVYATYKDWKANPIVNRSPCALERSTEEDDQKLDVVDVVYDTYKGHSGGYLIGLTHQEGTPWKKVYQKGVNVIIPNSLMKTYYQELLSSVQTDS